MSLLSFPSLILRCWAFTKPSLVFFFLFAAFGHCVYSIHFAGLQEEHGLQSQDPLGSYLGFAPSCCGLPGSQFPHLQNGAYRSPHPVGCCHGQGKHISKGPGTILGPVWEPQEWQLLPFSGCQYSGTET